MHLDALLATTPAALSGGSTDALGEQLNRRTLDLRAALGAQLGPVLRLRRLVGRLSGAGVSVAGVSAAGVSAAGVSGAGRFVAPAAVAAVAR